MKSNACKVMLSAAGLVCLLGIQTDVAAQAIWEPGVAGEPIPKNYKSWSLFVICNPDWLMVENEPKLSALYQRFRSFGQAIGAQHLALWFWKRQPRIGNVRVDDIDVDRNAAFCEKLALLPSKSPYVVVTRVYPDLNDSNLRPDVLIELNKLPPADVGNLLNKLTDQLLVEGLRQKDFDSEQYWGAWRRSVEGTANFLGGLIKKVKLTVNAGPVKLEVEGGRE